MNKGFTLIEILVVVTLVAAISITIGVNMSDMLNKQNAEKITSYENQIAQAGCVYAEVNNILYDSSVTVNVLIEKGYLRKDLTNPNTKAKVTEEGSNSVSIQMVNNERKCSYSAS